MATGFKYTWSCEAEGSVVEEAKHPLVSRASPINEFAIPRYQRRIFLKKMRNLNPFIITK